MPKIASINCHKLVNSRGDWTIHTKVTLDDGSIGIQAVPEGASRGENEAISVPVEQAIKNVTTQIGPALRGKDSFNQKEVDNIMIQLDGSSNKGNLGGNSILSVSLAVAKAGALSKKQPLYVYLKSLFGKPLNVIFPTPIFNILNGGKHAHNNLSFQEFMVIPAKNIVFDKAMDMGVEIYHALRTNLEKGGFDVDVGDEGGFAPNNFTVQRALDLIRESANKICRVGKDVFIGLDVAAGSFYNDGNYRIGEENKDLGASELHKYYSDLLKKYEIIYLEDPFYEKDYSAWEGFNKEFSKNLMVVADDLVVTNPTLLHECIDRNLANAVIVKPNQVGTLTETLAFVKKAQGSNMAVVVSHRSGDTAEDTFIADLAMAVNADFIKSGAPARGERVAKYNRLLEIFYDIQ